MAIRNRLLILLLTVALIPLLATIILRQISIRVARQRLAIRTSEALDASARRGLAQLLNDRAAIFARERQLVDALIDRQAREVEMCLAVDANGLHTLTAAYERIFQLAPEGTLRLSTALENGLNTTYPQSDDAMGPDGYDPRRRPWYRRTRAAAGIVRDGPGVDEATGQTVMTIAAPVRYPDGSFAGVTAINRTVEGILQNIQLPERWDEGAEKMLVIPGHPRDASARVLSVLMHERHVNAPPRRRRGMGPEVLESTDRNELEAIVDDLRANTAGVRDMEHVGERALWAYHPLNAGQAAILLIVPYERVTALARTTEEFLLEESTLWLEVTGVALLVVAAAAVILAARRARIFTEPIRELTDASMKLANGNYDVQVHIATRDELEELGRIFNETGGKLKERQKIKRSLELAKLIQQNLLPQKAPDLGGLDIAGQCVYCDETGGDYYDFIELPDPHGHMVGIALGDVTGHGIGAALLMASIRSALRAEARHYGPDLVSLFRELNKQIVRDTEDDKFVTLFYGLLDQNARSLTWASAGHDPALLYRAKDGQIVELGNTGMLMGLIEDAPFEQAGPLSLQSGDILVVGTDGIWEARNREGRLFGKERLCDIIRSGAGQTARELCATVTDGVMEFVGSAPRSDDITLVVVKSV